MLIQLRILFCFVLSICAYCAFGQEKKASHLLVENLNNRKQKLPQEKVHLHFDRSFYISGDTMRFASYVVNAVNNIPSDLSHVLYVELVDVNNGIIKSVPIQLVAGFGSGDFALSDSLPEGIYQVRAYTNWMRNFDHAFFFSKEINVFNPFANQRKTIASVVSKEVKKAVISSVQKYDFGFYPEGGQLVLGLSSRVGFKAIGPNGKGVMASGVLFDNNGKSILEFHSGHGGLGSFNLIPSKDREYTAVLNFPDGSTGNFKLPKVEQSGYVVSADNSNTDTLYVKLQASADLLNNRKMTFIPISNGSPLFFMETIFPDQQINLSIPKNKIPGGIIQLSLLNIQNQPVSERLVFNRYTDEIKLDIKGLKPTYAKGEQVEFELQATDRFGKPVVGSFSMSIVSGNSMLDGDSQTSIYSNLLLSSDLKGYIEQPNYYFNSINGEKEKALDNLMLTHGWRRYSWKAVALNQIEQTPFQAEQKIKISGQIKGNSKNSVIENIPITLLAGELGYGTLLDTLTNSEGRFSFFLPDSMGYLPLRIQAKPKKAASYEIIMDQYQSPEITERISGYPEAQELADAIKVSKAYGAYVNQLKASKERDFTFNGTNKLKEVTIRDYNPKQKLTNSHSANLNGPGQADKVILPDVLEKMPDLTTLDVLLPGVRKVGISGLRLNSSAGISHLPDMLILIDGVQGMRDLREISPRDVESIELLKNPAYSGIYGIRGSGGVLLITTKKGNYNQSVANVNTPNVIAKRGFFLRKTQFNDLSIGPLPVFKPDQSLYWNPEIITDPNGRSKIKFLFPIALKICTIKFEGVSVKGHLTHQLIVN